MAHGHHPRLSRLGLGVVAVSCLLLSADGVLAQNRGASRRPRRGHVVRTLPRDHTRVAVAGTVYYQIGGIFYRAHSGGYVVVAAPVGARIDALPADSVILTVLGRRFAYHHGVFYGEHIDQDGYVVTDPPLEAEVPYVPDGATIADLDGVLYYVYNDVYYRPAVRNGTTVYVVNEP